jgi:hypothetical protein
MMAGTARVLTFMEVIKELTFSFSKKERVCLFKTTNTGLP